MSEGSLYATQVVVTQHRACAVYPVECDRSDAKGSKTERQAYARMAKVRQDLLRFSTSPTLPVKVFWLLIGTGLWGIKAALAHYESVEFLR